MNTRSLFFGLAFCLVLMSSVTQAQKNVKREAQTPGWQKEWKQVDSLSDIGLPKSALEIVDRIYTSAKSSKDDSQFIKAVIYKIKLNSSFREDFMAGTIRGLNDEIIRAKEPSKQILQSILAEVYSKYYAGNLYRFSQRTPLANIIPDSLQTWDLNTITKAVFGNYLSSLSNDLLLKSTPVTDYKAIIEIPEAGYNGKKSVKPELEKAIIFRPTLYDFLANRALDFFTSSDGPKNQSALGFRMDNISFFAQTGEFVKLSIPSGDSLSPVYQAIRIYHDIAIFHLKDKNPAALIDAELQRFDFVREKAGIPARDSLYLDALTKFETGFKESPWSADIAYAIALFYQSQGDEKSTAPQHRLDIKKALETCEAAVKRFPESEGAKNCAILAKNIKNPEIEIKNETAIVPGKPSLALISYRNIQKVYLRLYKIDQGIWDAKKDKLKKEDLIIFFASQKPELTREQTLPDFGDYRKHSIEAIIPQTDPGFYVILACSDTLFSVSSKLIAWSGFTATSFNYISQRNADGGISLFIFNRETGMPAKGVTVEAWLKNYNYQTQAIESRKLRDFQSDNTGFVRLPAVEHGARYSNLYLKIIGADDMLVTRDFYQYPVTPVIEKPARQTSFFTDRAIYRPGQTVYFKGVVMEKKGGEVKLLPHENTHVSFMDVNGRRIAEQNFITNDFGSFNGSFTAPSGVLPGQMSISNESGTVSFSVEEYKRPTFELSFDPLEGNYKLNETLTVKGKATAYAGNAIDHATATYRVVRTARFPWRDRWFIPFPVSPETEIASGTVKTTSEGNFIFSFPALADFSVARSTNPVFDFQITVDVTDIGGETRSEQESVSVSYRSLLLGSGAPEKLNLQTDSLIKISATNLNGKPTPANVAVTIYMLTVPDRIFINRSWEKPDTLLVPENDFHASFPNFSYGNEDDTASWKPAEAIFNKVIFTGTDSMVNVKRYITHNGKERLTDPGVYVILLSADDPFGEKVKMRRYFTAFNPASQEIAGNPMNWFVPLKTSGNPGESASFLMGSKDKDVSVLYEIRVHDSLVSRKWIGFSNFQMVLNIPVLENYRGNFSVNLVFSKYNRIFQNSQVITVPYTDKKLNVVFETFRSKIIPGSKEEWKLRIERDDKKGADAEFLTAMYDASLDAFRFNSWSFDIYRKFFSIYPWDISNYNAFHSGSASGNMETGNYSEHIYPQLNWFGFNYFGGGRYPMMLKSGRMDKAKGLESASAMPVVAQNVNPENEPPQGDAGEIGGLKLPEETSKNIPAKSGFQIRRDFRETAFFYPDLRTDSSGSLVLQFTAPESLTRWKLLGFAYTRGLDYGLVEKELVTQKDLMVIPNAPRFVRQGDILVFSTRVVNLSAQDLKASVHIEFSDGISMKQADSIVLTPAEQEITIKKTESGMVSWNIRVPVDPSLSLLQYRITASSGAFTDGEEKLIPVLPDRMLVTESLPLPVRDKGSFDFSFDKLLSSSEKGSLRNYRLTLEFAANPAWYAVQALPALNEKQFDDAYSVFGAFYSNSIASFIMNSNPKIKRVFESWKTLTPDLLVSNLEKNPQLKSALLEQTPWVMEAKTETENRQKLGMYFDQDNLSRNLEKNLGKLKKLQLNNGGWTWFEGMPENRSVTQNIVGGLAHLEHLGINVAGSDPLVKQMLSKGVQFMDEAFQKSYEEMKRRSPDLMNENHLDALEIQYLYARSYFLASEPVAANLKEALNYYLDQSVRYWMKEDLSSQAMLALSLSRFGKAETSSLILKSLTERALHSQEMGMYWADEPGLYRRQAPVETQALLIEAFDEVAKDTKSVEDMKIWLLKQKQTQSWESSRATAEACYALLLRGTDLLADDPRVKITIGKEKIDPSKLTDTRQEAGTGYFQLSWAGKEIRPDMGKIRIVKGSEGAAWGAVYWQYYETMDKIKPAQTQLKLEKKLFLENITPSGPVLETVLHDGKLKVGDKLKVRIVLTADRDLEFVHMRDQRASAFEPYLLNTGQRDGPVVYSSGGENNALSGYRYQDGLGYYQSTTDASTDFFFDYIPKGTYVFEYFLLVNAAGDYSNGITTIQCMYAPEFSAHSEGVRVKIGN
jgi:hypothetical protein